MAAVLLRVRRAVKVLMVTGAYDPEISSGGRQVQLMAQALRGAVEIHVLTTAVDDSLGERASINGVEVTRVHVRLGRPLAHLAAAWRMFPVLLRLVRWCDVVHIHGVSSKNVLITAVARAFRRPIVLSLHTMGADQPAAVDRSGQLARWSFRAAAKYLAVSPALHEAMVDARIDRVAFVANGIDIFRFREASPDERRELKRAAGCDPDVPVVLFVGFFSHDKQPRVLFDAWLRLLDDHRIDATVCFVGATKSEYHEVDETIAAGMQSDASARGRSHRIIFTGIVADVERYYRLADLFVMPSRREGLPVALMEAMACALPCVASYLPGATDVLIRDGVSGRLVPVANVAAFASAIASLLTERSRAAAMGAAARQVIVDRFSSETIAQRWLECYRDVAGATSS
jgi:glycosyltransferase involved in cell wall biosynthesis